MGWEHYRDSELRKDTDKLNCEHIWKIKWKDQNKIYPYWTDSRALCLWYCTKCKNTTWRMNQKNEQEAINGKD